MNQAPDMTAPAARTKARPAVQRALDLVAADMTAVEARLKDRMHSEIGPIPDVGAHLLDAGGKRLRPLMATLAARAAGASIDLGIAVGVAAELIHTATLYHDDVVDDGRVRRGRPAARMVFGNGIVVLVGDFCLARALDTVASTDNLILVRSLAATVTEMAEGEVAQLEGAGNADATTEGYFKVIDRKTASLIAWCARVGGAAGGNLDAPLGRYGRAVGRAFQIVDDVLDCAAPESVAGKSVGRDLQEGKMTLPILLACEADPGLRARIRAELGETGVTEGAAARLLAEVRQVGGLERATRRAQDLCDEALISLDALPGSVYREALRDLALFSVQRVS